MTLQNSRSRSLLPVNLLTRGSVAERVLMFEKCPDVRHAFLNIKRPQTDPPPKSLMKVSYENRHRSPFKRGRKSRCSWCYLIVENARRKKQNQIQQKIETYPSFPRRSNQLQLPIGFLSTFRGLLLSVRAHCIID